MPIQRQISRLFYYHGNLCARFPVYILAGVIIVILFFWYPLLTLSIPSRTPYEFVIEKYNSTSTLSSTRPWLHRPPEAVIVQLLVAVHVSSRASNEVLRSALAGIFELHSLVRDFQHGNASLADLCVQVDEASALPPEQRRQLPAFGCLLLSPALLWQQDVDAFNADRDLARTIYLSPVKENLFGMPWRHTGVSRFNVRSRDRVISYCVTVFLRGQNQQFVDSLINRAAQLTWIKPVYLTGDSSSVLADTLTHIYFKDNSFLVEYTPLLVLYTILFLYIYFSVRKIQMVKSKWGLAFGACFTVVASLFMSVGVCMYFGIAPSLNGSETFPYLVVLIGMENVLVITKSVVSTPVELEVRHRIAVGLSKEGWTIMKSLIVEVGLLSLGLLSFNTSIQEFALFAVVGLCTDFFLQMFFFVTILAIDIKRMEPMPKVAKTQMQATEKQQQEQLSVREVPQDLAVTLGCEDPNSVANPPADDQDESASMEQLQRLHQFHHMHRRQPSDANTAAFLMHSLASVNPTNTTDASAAAAAPAVVPRRIRVLYYLASKRLALRLLLLLLGVWLLQASGTLSAASSLLLDSLAPTSTSTSTSAGESSAELTSSVPLDRPDDQRYWPEMTALHWPSLFSQYNSSLAGKYVTYLGAAAYQCVDPATAAVGLDEGVAGQQQQQQQQDQQPWWLLLNRPAALHGTWGLAAICLFGVTFVLTSTYALMLCCQLCGLAWLVRLGSGAFARPPPLRTVVPIVLPAHALDIDLVCWSTDASTSFNSRLLAVSSLDGSMSVWNVDGRQVAYFDRRGAGSVTSESGDCGCDGLVEDAQCAEVDGQGDGGLGLRQRVCHPTPSSSESQSASPISSSIKWNSAKSPSPKSSVWCLSLVDTGKLLVGCSDGFLELWSLNANDSHLPSCRIQLSTEGLTHLVALPSHCQLAIAATASGLLHSVRLSDTGLDPLLCSRASPLPLHSLLIWPPTNGHLLATGGEDNLIRFFSIDELCSVGLKSRQQQQQQQQPITGACCCSPVASTPCTVVSAHAGPVLALAAYPSRGLLSGGADGAVFQVSPPDELSNGFRQKRLVWQRQPVLSVSVTDRYAICGLADGQLLLLRLCTGAWRLLGQPQPGAQSPQQPLLCTWSPPCLLPGGDALVTTSATSGLDGLDVWCLARRRRLSRVRLTPSRTPTRRPMAGAPVQPVCLLSPEALLVCKCGPNLMLVPECQLT